MIPGFWRCGRSTAEHRAEKPQDSVMHKRRKAGKIADFSDFCPSRGLWRENARILRVANPV